MNDPRINTIARCFCVGHYHGPGIVSIGTPCATCRSRARSAVDALDNRPTLFDQPPATLPLSDPAVNTPGVAPRNPTDTQTAARWAAYPKTGSQRERILRVFVNDYDDQHPHGFTDEELVEATRMSPSTVRPRRGELVAGGWLWDGGQRRNTQAGLPAIVWELRPEAWRAFWAKQAVSA